MIIPPFWEHALRGGDRWEDRVLTVEFSGEIFWAAHCTICKRKGNELRKAVGCRAIQNASIADQQRIERLFEQAGKDRSKAFELKQELDRLGVFKDYEDRFLDLFKEPD
jgi:hypothetical protein